MVVNGTITHVVGYTKPLQMAFILACIFITAGCASSDNTLKYYLLHPTYTTSNNTAIQPHNELLLKQIIVPEYLKQRGLVYQTSATNIHIATDHLWAEPIEEGITKTLKQAFQPLGITLTTSQTSSKNNVSSVILRIDDFIATWHGDVILRGQYDLLNPSGSAHIMHNFHLILPLEDDGFSSSVEVMRLAINQLSEQIVNALEQQRN